MIKRTKAAVIALKRILRKDSIIDNRKRNKTTINEIKGDIKIWKGEQTKE